ncbi:MAG: hypothetical protein ACFE9T_10350 [Promethearchaeota archaeon]
MEEIKLNLLDSEKILWQRSKTVNLLRFIKWTVLFMIIFPLLICGIFISIFIVLGDIIGIILAISIIIIGELLIIGYTIKDYKKKRNSLHLTSQQLKNYKFYDILTNKRYIRRNYHLNFSKNLNFHAYPSKALTITDDFDIILNLDFVTKVILDIIYKDIHLVVESKNNKYASDVYIEYSEEEFDDLINILTKVLSLEEKDRYSDHIVYLKTNR